MDITRKLTIHGRPVEYTILYSSLDGITPEEVARRVKTARGRGAPGTAAGLAAAGKAGKRRIRMTGGT